jgi:dTDP-4-dehydrorhamnose reductase
VRIAVTGAGGLLGAEVVARARDRGHDVVPLGRAELDVRDAARVRGVIAGVRPDAVVHCAAYTAVDRAESEPEVARAVNRDGTRHVAEASRASGAALVYVSTDYVFDGCKRTPYLPADPPGPLSVYGRTKLEGEQAANEAAPGALVVRTSWLYGALSGFVPAILGKAAAGEALRIVDDQRGRPTWAPDLAEALLDLMEAGERGTWHVAGGGACTWLELAREALSVRGLDVPVQPISSADFGAPARRPAYSVLDLDVTEQRLGRPMRPWREALHACLTSEH